MARIETFERGGFSDRRLHVLELEDATEIEQVEIQFPQRCASLVAWDAAKAPVKSISLVCQTLLGAGAVSLCSWGEDCERVHDIFDEVLLGPDPPATQFPDLVVTTWHAREPLDQAIWYLLFASIPDEEFIDSCRDSLFISIGKADWANRAREAFSDADAFNHNVLASDAI